MENYYDTYKRQSVDAHKQIVDKYGSTDKFIVDQSTEILGNALLGSDLYMKNYGEQNTGIELDTTQTTPGDTLRGGLEMPREVYPEGSIDAQRKQNNMLSIDDEPIEPSYLELDAITGPAGAVGSMLAKGLNLGRNIGGKKFDSLGMKKLDDFMEGDVPLTQRELDLKRELDSAQMPKESFEHIDASEANQLNEQMFDLSKGRFGEIEGDPSYFNDKKKGLKTKVVYMDPNDYMKMVEKRQPDHAKYGTDDEKMASLKEAYESGTKVPMPQLAFGARDYPGDDYFAQEGYNRAATATMINKTKIPVSVRYRSDDENIPDFIKKYLD